MGKLTQAQLDCLDRIRNELNEHFEAWVLTYEAETSDQTDICLTGYSAKSFTHAVGMARIAVRDLELKFHPTLPTTLE